MSHSSFGMQLAGVLHLWMCLDAPLQGTPSKQSKGDTGVARKGHKADVGVFLKCDLASCWSQESKLSGSGENHLLKWIFMLLLPCWIFV